MALDWRKDLNVERFEDFEGWIDQNGLLHSDVLYRGQREAIWRLESTLDRHRRTSFGTGHPSRPCPVADYGAAARNLQAIVETHTDRVFGKGTRGHNPFPMPSELTTATDPLSFEDAVYLRHHGFPSPLLDWTLSPYVAAYFAFEGATDGIAADDDESRVAVHVMRPPRHPYKDYISGRHVLIGQHDGIQYWPHAVTGETRHYDQQSRYTTALRYISYDGGETGTYCYDSHEYILREFPQEVAADTNNVSAENAIDGAISWKVTIPTRRRGDVLRRLDKMNINAYTMFRTDDALVQTYGVRELRRYERSAN